MSAIPFKPMTPTQWQALSALEKMKKTASVTNSEYGTAEKRLKQLNPNAYKVAKMMEKAYKKSAEKHKKESGQGKLKPKKSQKIKKITLVIYRA